MYRLSLLASCALLLAGAPALAQLPVSPVADAELAQARGRFTLPSGQELALTVRSDTSVDGQLLLRSVLTVDDAVGLTVFAPSGAGGAESQSARATTAASAAAAKPVIVGVDPATGMPSIHAVTAGASPAITVRTGTQSAPSNSGLRELPIIVGGPAIETPGGAVRVIDGEHGRAVTLSGDGIGVSQLLGPSFGSVIANTASNRTIDTATTVDIALSNMGSTLVDSAMLRVAGIVASVARTPF